MLLSAVSQLEIAITAAVVHLIVLAYGILAGKATIGVLIVAWACFLAVLVWGQIVRRIDK